MKKIFFAFSALVVMLFMAGCNNTNPIWGLWTQEPALVQKTEIMFNDDNTGFVFVADTAKYETKWQQDSLLIVKYVDPYAKEATESKSYRVSIDGNTMKLEDVNTGKVTNYSRYVEK